MINCSRAISDSVRPRQRIPLICRLNKVQLADAQRAERRGCIMRPTCTLQLAQAWALNCGKLPRKSGNRMFNCGHLRPYSLCAHRARAFL